MQSYLDVDIEPKIFPIVKYLNESGYVTVGSCGHGMWVRLLHKPNDKFDVLKLTEFLIDSGYEDFKVILEYEACPVQGFKKTLIISWLTIYFDKSKT